MLLMETEGWTNVKGSGNRVTCKCRSWKNHWLKYSGKKQWPNYCCVKGCTETAEDGGHVKNQNVEGEWIIPLCKTHNNPNCTEEFEICNNTYGAPANRAETCEKNPPENKRFRTLFMESIL